MILLRRLFTFFFFFNDTATTEIYTLSLHDALPIWPGQWNVTPRPKSIARCLHPVATVPTPLSLTSPTPPYTKFTTDRKSTRLNSSHLVISYAVFCLKKKKNIKKDRRARAKQITN